MTEITAVRHAYPEAAGFFIDRKQGYGKGYTLLHFHNSVEIGQDGGTAVTQPHAVIIYDPETPQYFKSREPLIHDWMHFKGDISETAGLSALPLNTVFYPANFSCITKIIAEIECEFFADEADRGQMLRLKLGELFIKIGRGLKKPEYQPQSPEMLEKFQTLRGEMFMSLSEEWTVGRMAERVFLSESRFYSLYKSFFGISPLADLINAKINSAKNMLVFGKSSIEETAALLGYQNTTHFIRQFKQHTGTTPAKYRFRR